MSRRSGGFAAVPGKIMVAAIPRIILKFVNSPEGGSQHLSLGMGGGTVQSSTTPMQPDHFEALCECGRIVVQQARVKQFHPCSDGKLALAGEPSVAVPCDRQGVPPSLAKRQKFTLI